MKSLLLLAALLASGCWWRRNPGPAALDEAEGPVSLVARRVEGPTTWVYLAARAGSAHDPIGKEGLAWLTARLLREGGAGERSPEQVEEALYAVGADVEVVVDKELVTFRARALAGDLPALTRILGDMLLAPRLDEPTFQRLRAEAADWLVRGAFSDDEALGFEVFDNWLHQGHPYGHPTRGRAGVVPRLTVADVRRFVDDRYVRPAITLGVAGPAVLPAPPGPVAGPQGPPIDSSRPDGAALAALHDRLSTLPPRLYDDVTPRVRPTVKGREILVVEKPTGGTGILLGHPIEADRAHPDWPALVLALTALGEHRQGHGRLYRALRGDRGLNYGDYAYVELFRQAGSSSDQETGTGRVQNPFVVWIRPVAPENGPFALRAAVALVDRFAREGLGPEEFERMKAYVTGRIALWAVDPGRRLGWAVESRAMGWPDPIDDLPPRIAALGRDEVNAAIARHLRPADLRVLVVTADAGPFRRAFAPSPDGPGAPTPMVWADPPPQGSPLAEEDAAFAAFDLGATAVNSVPMEGLFR